MGEQKQKEKKKQIIILILIYHQMIGSYTMAKLI